jgi:multidrug resistance efflux pump
MADKAEYVEFTKVKLDELETQVAIAEEKTENARHGAKEEYREQSEMLRSRYENARAKLKELEETGDESWQDLQPAVDGALGELEHTIANVLMHMG